jgi:hypothetical protein
MENITNKLKTPDCLLRHAATALLIAILIFCPILFAEQTAFDDYKEKYGNYFNNRMAGWFGLCLLAIAISIIFNALVYMAGKGFNSTHLMTYAKSELLQVTASSMMIFFAVSLLYLITSGGGSHISAIDFIGEQLGTGDGYITCSATAGGKFHIWSGDTAFGVGPLAGFKCRVQERITAMDTAFENIKSANKPKEAAEAFSFMMFGIPVYSGAWDFSLHKDVESAHLMAQKLTDTTISLHVQYILLEYLQKNMLTVFVPFGLALRIFPLTRGVGGLLIALGVGFFFVFPTFYLLTDPSFVKIKGDDLQEDRLQGVCFTGFRGAAALVGGTYSVNSEQSVRAFTMAISNASDLVYDTTVSMVFYPFVALTITLIFVRALTPLLGGDLGELMKMAARLG